MLVQAHNVHGTTLKKKWKTEDKVDGCCGRRPEKDGTGKEDVG